MKILNAREQLAPQRAAEAAEILFEYGSIAKVDLEKAEQSRTRPNAFWPKASGSWNLPVGMKPIGRQREGNCHSGRKLAKALENMEHFTVTAPVLAGFCP